MILPSQPFALERHMLAPLADGLPHLLRREQGWTVRILREPMMGPIIPDLLVGCWPHRQPPHAYAATTWIDAHIRALLERDGPMTGASVREALHLSVPAVSVSRNRLIKHGVLARDDDRDLLRDTSTSYADAVWRLAPGAETTGLEIIAIEAKLTRWPDAVRQAGEYLRFADRSYVVLDGNQVRWGEPLCAAVHAASVGLIFQHGRVLRHVIPAPVHPAPLTAERVLAVTKLATRRGGRAFRVRVNTDESGSARPACDEALATSQSLAPPAEAGPVTGR